MATMVGSEEKTRLFWALGPYEYRTSKQAAQEELDTGFGLRKLGLEKGDKVAIYAETSYITLYLFGLIQCNLAIDGSRYC